MPTPEQIFDEARKLYPNPQKRGLSTEFTNFKKKYKCWREFLPLLLPAVQAQIAWRETAKGEWRPPWKNFPSWINQRWWEFSPITQQKTIKRCFICNNYGETKLAVVEYSNATCELPVCPVCFRAGKHKNI